MTMKHYYSSMQRLFKIVLIVFVFSLWSAVTGTCPSAQFEPITDLQAAVSADSCSCSSILTKTPDSTVQLEDTSSEYGCKACNTWHTVENMPGEYMIPDGTRAFENSRRICQTCGGNVVVLNSTNLVNTIVGIVDVVRNRENNLWIGIVRNSTNREFFEWMDGRPFNESGSAWRSGQPNDSPGLQDCVASLLSDSWMLQDKQCHETYNILCQRPGYEKYFNPT
ncbi:C-type isolectin Sp-CL4-like [Apostichopus japonicus]|uniref:C-type isolectin Sp-CL4-like n=1 Tax=Stichopus japonicus TaxID=307972 RepID=UPI003AB871D3